MNDFELRLWFVAAGLLILGIKVWQYKKWK